MAAGGLHPVVAVYSTFLQRAYDQMIHDVCLNRLPVTFAIDRAGLVGSDGETHQGIFGIFNADAGVNGNGAKECVGNGGNAPFCSTAKYPYGNPLSTRKGI